MVKKRSLREKVTEEKEAKEKKEKEEKKEEKKEEHAADKSKWVIKIKKPNLKFLKSLKPAKSLKSLKPLALYFLLGAIAIIAAFFIFRGIIMGPVAFGDKVNISYSLELEDGTVIDSSSGDFILGSISTEFGFISNKLDNIIKKMKAGEEKIIELEPADAFGEYDKQKIDTINRTREMNKTLTFGPESGFSLAEFKESFKEEKGRYPEIGDSLPYNQFWNVTIVGIGEETITLKHELKGGEVLPLEPDGNVTVHLEEDKIILTFNPGKQLLVGDGLADVIDVTDDEIILDYNVPLAGNIVIVKVKVNEIEKAIARGKKGKIAGAPTLQAFVMTHCPYGTQIEKGLIPIHELLGEKANIEIRFVSYTMHGQKEEDETRLQLCLREEQPELYWSYLQCFLEAGNSAECLEKVNYDKSALTNCISTKADSYWQEDKELNTLYGVRGSPTIVLDDKVVQPQSRASEDIKELLCGAFTEEPSECKQQLSTTQPSPGFGFSGEGSGGGGSCG